MSHLVRVVDELARRNVAMRSLTELIEAVELRHDDGVALWPP
ncbi:hypothetical protein [Isoptericola peretonis]